MDNAWDSIHHGQSAAGWTNTSAGRAALQDFQIVFVWQ
jgi:hypothetical protein